MSELLGITFLALSWMAHAEATGLWCYDSLDPKCGPSHWKEITSGCGGQNQSPINIDRRKVRQDRSLDEILFEGYDQAPPGRWRLLNNGDEVKMTLDGASAAEQINITRGGLRDTYRALQVHFHWGDLKRNGSEHYIDGIQYPMELHIVHMNIKCKTINEAKQHPNGFAVLSFLFKVADTDNTNYNTVVASLRNITRAGEYVDMASTFSLSNLLPSLASLSKYYRYKGSLTTPNCDEAVTWTVFEEQIPISRSQLNIFVDTTYFKSSAGTPQKMVNNFRPLQLLNGRTVYASRDATISGGSSLVASVFLPLLLSCLVGQFSGSS
ncbi:carbonic anhydrase 15-like [Crotalus tigris]|uniref:carbonic anhydrase 15-like n=1 Tax=Crotalus tigris TaxID=88082 RepID=UPI00192F6561|nr:carbonic anhydrase 15-like [Crotalus tigris]